MGQAGSARPCGTRARAPTAPPSRGANLMRTSRETPMPATIPAEPPPQPVEPLGPGAEPPRGPQPLSAPVTRQRNPSRPTGLGARLHRRAIAALLATCACTAAAMQGSQPPAASPRGEASGTGDSGMVKQPPAVGNPEMIRPAPAPSSVDPGMAKRPPDPAAQADRDAAGPPQRPATQGAGRPSREDDCKGPAALCKQDSAR
jgi:hypothetical protein